MFQGSNVHFSPVDHKPLCSYSVKVCKQRRLNGYAFCVRHILEDPTAPFKQCEYVLNAKAGPQRCTNAIPNDKERQFCNSHMQVMGYIPKKERKNKAKDKPAPSVDMDATFSLESRLKSRFSLTRTNSKFSDKSINDPDDPYAFPDTEPTPVQTSYSPSHAGGDFSHALTKPETSFSAAKMFPELAEKLERAANKAKPEPKMKGTKSSRTMNRLQTRIAQNKIKDKLKRNQEFSSQGTTPEYQPSTPQTPVSQPFCVDNSQRFYFDNRPKPNFAGHLSNGPLLAASLNSSNCSSAAGGSLTNSFSKSFSQAAAAHMQRQSSIPRSNSRFRRQASILSEAEVKKRLKRDSAVSVYRYHAMKKAYSADLLTFGPDDSDSGSDEDLFPWQPTWFSVSSDEDESEEQDESSRASRMVNLSLFKTRLRRQYSQLRKSQLANVTMRLYDNNASQSLVKAAKESVVSARKAVVEINKTKRRRVSKVNNKNVQPSSVEKRSCLYKNEDENVTCSNTALPYANHCMKHILYNVDQQLFDYCTGRCQDNSQCCTPVFDVLHEYPVCHRHSEQAVSLESVAETPVKRPRKKPKPLALLRPAKKKKKNNRKLRPQKPMPSLEPTGNTAMPATPTLVSTHESFPAFTAKAATSVHPEENDLLPGAIDRSLELPLDGEAKILDDHELNDVLNKLPEEAFNDFFSGKNGVTDEASELEAALAANLSKETLDAMTKGVMMDTVDDDGDEGELPNHIADAILQQEDELNSLNNITSSFSSNDFKAMAQTFNGPLAALGNITTESLQQFIAQGSLPVSQPQQSGYGQTTYTSAPTIQALLQRPPMSVEHHTYGVNDSALHHQQYGGSMASAQYVNNVNTPGPRPTLHIPQHVNSTMNCHSPGGHAPSPHTTSNSPHSHHSPQVQSPMPSPITNYRPTWPPPADRAVIPTSYQNGYPSQLPPYPQGNIKYQYPLTDGAYPPSVNTTAQYPAGPGLQYPGYDVRPPQLPHYAGMPPANS